MPDAMPRSLGNTIVAVVAIPLALWSLFIGGLFALLGGFAGVGAALQGVVAIVVGLGLLVTAYGVWTMQPWGATIGIAMFGIDSARRVAAFIWSDPVFFAVSALFTVCAIGSAAYLIVNREEFEEDPGASNA